MLRDEPRRYDEQDEAGSSSMMATARAFLVGAVLPWVALGCTAAYIASLTEIDDGLEGLWFVPISFGLAAVSVFAVTPRARSLLALVVGSMVSAGLGGLVLGFGIGFPVGITAIATVFGALVGTFVHDGWVVARRARSRSRQR